MNFVNKFSFAFNPVPLSIQCRSFWYHVGLKIQSLRLEEREAAAKEEASADDDDAAGNGNGANDGPWKKIETAPVASDDHTEVVSEAKEVIECLTY